MAPLFHAYVSVAREPVLNGNPHRKERGTFRPLVSARKAADVPELTLTVEVPWPKQPTAAALPGGRLQPRSSLLA
jgi:hypothetical protein